MFKLSQQLLTKRAFMPRMQLVKPITSMRTFSAFANHRDTEENLEETPFELTNESHEAIKALMHKYPDNYKASVVIPALFIA
jgi:hypothetical protein